MPSVATACALYLLHFYNLFLYSLYVKYIMSPSDADGPRGVLLGRDTLNPFPHFSHSNLT